MPRNNGWFDDDTMMRDRDRNRGRSERRPNRYGNEDNDRAFFGSDRDSYRDRDRGRNDKYNIGGWGERPSSAHAYESPVRDRSDRERSERRDEDRRYGSDDYNRGIPMDETKKLIASNKVEGTPVYDRHGDKLGSIHNFMVDKRKGNVVYAVLKHGGGFLGLNERYYPLEWDQLTYDTRLDGYHVDMTDDDLKSFGSFDSEGRWQRRRPHGERDRSPGRDRNYDRDRW